MSMNLFERRCCQKNYENYHVSFCIFSLCHIEVVPDIAGRPRVYLDIAIDAMPVGRIATRVSPVRRELNRRVGLI